MRRRQISVGGVIALLTCVALLTLPKVIVHGGESSRSVSQRYSGTGGQLDVVNCQDQSFSGAGLMGLHVEVTTLDREVTVDLQITDDVGGDDVIALVGQSDRDYRWICGGIKGLPIEGGEVLDVYLFNGYSERGQSVVTQGTVEATFYRSNGPPSRQATPRPQPTGQDGSRVDRAFERFSLKRHLVVSGRMSSDPYEPTCTQDISVSVQRGARARSASTEAKPGPVSWRTVASARTDERGVFEARLPDRVGPYRAKVAVAQIEAGTCSAAHSPVRRHHHN
jgi:hypothetical protein